MYKIQLPKSSNVIWLFFDGQHQNLFEGKRPADRWTKKRTWPQFNRVLQASESSLALAVSFWGLCPVLTAVRPDGRSTKVMAYNQNNLRSVHPKNCNLQKKEPSVSQLITDGGDCSSWRGIRFLWRRNRTFRNKVSNAEKFARVVFLLLVLSWLSSSF